MTSQSNNSLALHIRVLGNKLFAEGKIFEALNYFNASLLFAKKNETKYMMSLAYANRSAVYLKGQEWEKCMENINLARGCGHPKKWKLDEREATCHEQLANFKADPEENPWNFFKLSYPADGKIPFIVDCLELREDEKFRRGIYTNRDLKPGDVVAIEQSHFSELYFNGINSRCVNCLKTNSLSLIPSPDDVMFCSQRCYDELYGRVEKFEPMEHKKFLFPVMLNALDFSGGVEELDSMMLEVKATTVFDYDWSKPEDPETKRNILKCLLSLQQKREIPPGMTASADEYVKAIKANKRTAEVLKRFFLRYQHICHLNGIHVVKEDDRQGFVTLLFGSLFNHSCDANLRILEVDGQFVAVVSRPIAAGDQIFNDYGTSFHRDSKEKRQGILLNEWEFTCECTACTSDYPMLRELKRFDVKSEFPRGTLFGTVKESVQEMKRNNEYIEKNVNQHPSLETGVVACRNYLLLRHIAYRANCPFTHVIQA